MNNGNMQCGDTSEKRVYSVDEIARLLRVSKGSVYGRLNGCNFIPPQIF